MHNQNTMNLDSVMWSSDINALENPPSASIAEWLTKPLILSDALEKAHGELTVEVHSEEFTKPYAHEIALLEGVGKDDPYFIRQVFLKHHDQVLTYGRVVIPESTFIDNQAKILALGDKSFGITILYSHPNYTRSPFEYAYTHHYWGRRSVFFLNTLPLIVTEFYMTDLGAYPE